MNQVWIAFITGVTAGGISCLAVQGGLLASSLSQVSDSKKRPATVIFLGSKLVSYILLGALLGFFGSQLSISPTFQGWLQILAGLYMFVTVANILELHPIFRYAVIQPPKWAYKLLKKESHRDAVGPAFLGALTILIPCGITQGMMILAISSGNPLVGAAILGAFTLGTSPLFLAIGLATGEFMKRKAFAYVASAFIFALAVNSISAGNALRGSPHTLGNYWNAVTNQAKNSTAGEALAAIDENGIQEVTIEANADGYSTSASTLKVGVPVKIKLLSKGAVGCVQVFTIPTYNIKKVIPQNGEDEIAFTPTKTGRLPFSCAMGMYSGEFQVI